MRILKAIWNLGGIASFLSLAYWISAVIRRAPLGGCMESEPTRWLFVVVIWLVMVNRASISLINLIEEKWL